MSLITRFEFIGNQIHVKSTGNTEENKTWMVFPKISLIRYAISKFYFALE